MPKPADQATRRAEIGDQSSIEEQVISSRALLPQSDELSASSQVVCGGAAQLSRFAVASGGIRDLLSLRAERRVVRAHAGAFATDERRAYLLTPEQFEAEFNAVNEMYLKYFKLFGIEKYLMRFSTHDPSKLGQKFVDEPELWKKTEEMTRSVLKDSGINYVEVPNEAAFYGPKIDVQAWSVIGREFSIATNQVDFAAAAPVRSSL